MKRYRRMIITYQLHQPDQDPLPDLPPKVADLTISERFERFHAENPTVYARLRDMALIEAAQGAQRISTKLLFERLRAQGPATANGADPYRFDNSYTSRYARMLAAEAGLNGRIPTRPLQAE